MSKGAIAAGHTQTLLAGQEILKAGGNSFDAAIAATFAMFASEPYMASAGAGGFAMCHSAHQGTQLLDFFTQTPKFKNLDRPLDFRSIEVDFGTETEVFHVGKASICTPGVIEGLFELHRKLGTLPMRVLVEPAQALARNGVTIDAFGAGDLRMLQNIFAIDSSVRDIFFNDKDIKKLGDTLRFPHLADFLDFIVQEGSRGFYYGEIAQKVCKQITEGGGFLTRSDFENYEVRWSNAMHLPYYKHTLCLPNGPSMGGAIIALLHHYNTSNHLPITSRLFKVKEQIHVKGQIQKSLNELYPSLNYHLQGSGKATKGTSHISILDKKGNSVALTISIGEGSGYWIPGTDMQMNNMLGETFLLPNGHHSWIPDRRLNSMMTPVLVLNDNGKVTYAGGSGGAGRIPYMIYQVLEALFHKGQNLVEATNAARQHWHDGELHYEETAEIKALPKEKKYHCWTEPSLFFGGVHSIMQDKNGNFSACGDARRCGVSQVI